MTLERWGWYPRGGGEVRLTINPSPRLSAVQWQTPPELAGFRAISAASRLPEHVARRQAARLRERLGADLPVEHGGGRRPGPRQPGLCLGAAGRLQRPGGQGQTGGAGGG